MLRLTGDDDAARKAIADAVTALLGRGLESPRLRIVASGDTLSAPTIAALILGLRRLREHGGAIELRGETDGVRAAIVLNGLDRVLAFPIVPGDDVDRRPAKRGGFRSTVRAAAAVLAVWCGLAGLGAPAQAQSTPNPTDPAEILGRVIDRNPDLASYQSRLHVDVQLQSFPFIAQHLDGSTYFKRPANYEVVFDRVPSYAKGFEKLYSDVGDPSNWESRFVITYAGEAPFEGRSDLVLHMVQRVRGMIDHETVLVDPNAWTIDQIRYDYYNGGVITMTQHFGTIGGYTMLSSQTAEIRIPHVRATARGRYTDYHANVAIADSVFTKNK